MWSRVTVWKRKLILYSLIWFFVSVCWKWIDKSWADGTRISVHLGCWMNIPYAGQWWKLYPTIIYFSQLRRLGILRPRHQNGSVLVEVLFPVHGQCPGRSHWILTWRKELRVFRFSFINSNPTHGIPSSWLKVKVAQSCLTLWHPMDCSSPISSVHGIPQARIVQWVAFPFSRGSSQPRDWTQVSLTAVGFFTIWATREASWLNTLSKGPAC